jgi:predicted N-acetyltransferase YhbS
MMIRQERVDEYSAVYDLIYQAFLSAEHRDGTEQDLAAALRHSREFVPQLSLVAQCGNTIVGHCLFTKATVGHHTVLALAPLAVLPEYQRRGVGTALVREGHRIAREMGFPCVIVLGSQVYYPRLGYVPAGRYGIQAPFDVPPENFMVCSLQDRMPFMEGIIQYAPEFGITVAE